jgi:RND family efflux transporter MFP subunit
MVTVTYSIRNCLGIAVALKASRIENFAERTAWSMKESVNPMPLQNYLRMHKTPAAVVVCVIFLGGVLIFAVGRSNKPAHPPMLPPSEVEVVEVQQRDVPLYSEWIGTTDGMVNAEIRAQVSGYLLKKDYTEGSFVRKGQLLFEIDPRPFQAALDLSKGKLAQAEGQLGQADSQFTQSEAQVGQAQAQVSQSQSQLAQQQANQLKAQLDVNKYEPLRRQKAVTQQELDNAVQANEAALAQVKAAEAGVQTTQAQVRAAVAQMGTAKAAIASAKAAIESARAEVETAQLNLSFTRIVAPIDGIAGLAQGQVGDLISSGSAAALTTISTVNPIKVYFTVNEQEYLDYARRNPTQAQRDASAKQIALELVLADGTTYPYKGGFFVADRQVDQKTGTIRLAGIFPNPENVLRPGQYGRVRAVTSTKEDALVVPQRAVTELQGAYQVAVVGDDSRVSIRTVKVGDRVGPVWVIVDGLKAGEKIVAEGTQKVGPGATVIPKPYRESSSEATQ